MYIQGQHSFKFKYYKMLGGSTCTCLGKGLLKISAKKCQESGKTAVYLQVLISVLMTRYQIRMKNFSASKKVSFTDQLYVRFFNLAQGCLHPNHFYHLRLQTPQQSTPQEYVSFFYILLTTLGFSSRPIGDTHEDGADNFNMCYLKSGLLYTVTQFSSVSKITFQVAF